MPLTRPGSEILEQNGIERRSIENGLSLSNITRQSVQTGRVDSNGYANFLSAGAGLDVDINAVSDPLVVAIANGFDKQGAVDKIEEINADVNIPGLSPNATNYLYMDRNAITGAITYGATKNLPPIYGTAIHKSDGVGKSYLSLDGVDASTSIIDANPINIWTPIGNTQLDTAQKKFGTASMLFDGSADRLESDFNIHAGEDDGGFKFDMWIRPNVNGTSIYLFEANTNLRIELFKTSGNVLLFSMSSNGASWDIANGISGTATITTGAWYHVRIQWDTTTYKIYVDGVEDISITSSTPFLGDKYFYLGSDQSGNNVWNGWMDDISFEWGTQTLGAFTPPTVARGSLAADGENWFDLNTFKMNEWDQTNGLYVEKQRVFLGEAVTDGSSVTSLITYALKGQYDSDWFDIATSTTYIKNHNIGVNIPLLTKEFFKVDKKSEVVSGTTMQGTNSNNGFRASAVNDINRNVAKIRTGNFGVSYYPDTTGSSVSISSGFKRIVLNRDW